MRLLALAGLALLIARDAHANATAIPDTVQVLAASPDPNRLVMNTTFGFLFSADAGATWSWTCHETITTASASAPKSSLSPQGDFFVAVPLLLAPQTDRGLWRTANDGCDWGPVDSLDDVLVRSVVFSSDGGIALAVGSNKAADTALAWRSSDGGLTFGAPVLALPGAIFNNALFANANVYLAGIDTTAPAAERAKLWRSDDRGTTWDVTTVPSGAQPPLYVLAVSGSDVWLRNDSGAIDRVLFSSNGGASFAEAFTIDADIQGFALTQAGAARWLGLKRSNGLFAATAADPTFDPIAGTPHVRCLESDGDVLFVCADPNVDGLAAGRTTDGATWTTAMVFSRIQGPLACAPGSDSTTICDPLWPSVAIKLGIATPAPSPTPDGGDDDGGGGCSCRTASASGQSLLLALLAGTALFLRRRGKQLILTSDISISCLAVALVLVAGNAHAQETVAPAGSFELQRFHLAPPSDGFAVVRDTHTQDPWRVSATFGLTYADRPLAFMRDGERVAGIVNGVIGGEAALSLGLRRDLEVWGVLPLTIYQDASNNFYTRTFVQREVAATGVNDPRFGLKWRLMDQENDKPLSLALLPAFSAPAGFADDFMGFEEPTGGLSVLAARQLGPLRVAANLGYLVKPETRIGTLEIDDELTWALAAQSHLPWVDRLDVRGEIFGASVVKSLGDEASSPIEVAVTGRWAHRPGLAIFAGGGAGIGSGFGAPRFRVVGGVHWGIPSRYRAALVFADVKPDPGQTPEEREKAKAEKEEKRKAEEEKEKAEKLANEEKEKSEDEKEKAEKLAKAKKEEAEKASGEEKEKAEKLAKEEREAAEKLAKEEKEKAEQLAKAETTPTPAPTPTTVAIVNPQEWTASGTVCKKVTNKKAVNPTNAFTLADGRVYVLVEATGPAPGEIHVVWYKEKTLIEDKVLPVDVSPWVGYANKTLRDDGAKGEWRVEIRDSKKKVLQTLTFKVD